MKYTPDVTLIVDAAQRDALEQMLVDAGIEGCVGLFQRPLWDEGTVLVYDKDGQIDMAKSPAPVAYLSHGWLHQDAYALLPEGVVVPPDPTPTPTPTPVP